MNRQFTKEEIHMALNHIKCNESCRLKNDVQFNSMMTYHFKLSNW